MMNRKTAMTMFAGGLFAITASAMAATPSEELQADAAKRSSYLAEGGTSGFSNGHYFISDGTRANRLELWGFTKLRYTMNFRDVPDGSTEEDFTHGFSMRETQLIFGGNIWDPAMYWQVQTSFNDAGDFTLKNAYIDYKWDNGLSLRVGQFKLPLLREELVSDYMLGTIERSIMNSVFSGGRAQGVGIKYQQDQWRVMGAFSDGADTVNTPFDSTAEADFAFTARGEYIFMGGSNWDRFDGQSSFHGADTAVMAGAALHYQDGGSTGATGGATTDVSAWQFTLDCTAQGDGWNGFGAFVYRNVEPPVGDSVNDFGFVLQGGYFFTDQLEGFARWDGVFPDDSDAAPADPFNTLSLGVNYFISPNSHAAKFTAQLNYFLDGTLTDDGDGGTTSSTGGLVGADTNHSLLDTTEDGQFALTLQLQGAF